MPLDALFPDDIFISYSRRDASTYAAGLADKLTEKGFSCFIDRLGTDPNKDLPGSLRNKIRSCRMLIIVGTQIAGTRWTIAEEIYEFRQTKRTSIVPIDFNGAIEKARWYSLIQGIAIEPELDTALSDGNPSLTVISRIEKQFTYARRNERLRRRTIQAAIVLFALVLFGIGATVYAGRKVAEARKALADVEQAEERTKRATATLNQALTDTANAQCETEVANSKTTSALAATQTAQAEARTATAVAVEQRRLAVAAAKDAEKKTQLAAKAERARTLAQAETEVQQKISFSRRLVNQANTLLNQDPSQLPTSVLLASESIKRYPTLEANQLLRTGLALLPRPVVRLPLTEKAQHLYSSFGSYSNDGKYFVTGSDTNHAIVWNVPAGQKVARIDLDEHDKIESINVSPDGVHLIIRAYLRHTFVYADWTTTRPRRVAQLLREESEFVKPAFSPDGKLLATVATQYSRPRVWANWASMEPRNILPASVGIEYVNDVAFSHDGAYLVTQQRPGQSERQIRLWNIATGEEVPFENVLGAFSSDKRYLFTTHEDETLRIHKLETGEEIRRVSQQSMALGSGYMENSVGDTSPGGGFIEYSPETDYLAVPGEGNVSVWQVEDGLLMKIIPVEDMKAMLFSPDGKRLAIASGRRESQRPMTRVWEIAADRLAPTEVMRVVTEDETRALTFSPAGDQLATIGQTAAQLWEMHTHPAAVRLATPFNEKVFDMAWSPGGSHLAVGAFQKTYVWSNVDYRQVARMDETSYKVSFSRDEKYLVTVHHKGTHVWQGWETGKPVQINSFGHSGENSMVAVSRDDKYLVTGGDRDTVKVWAEWKTSKPELIATLPHAAVKDVAFSPDGRYLLTTGAEIRFWLAWNTTRPVHSFSLTGEQLGGGKIPLTGGVAFSRDGQYLALSTLHGLYVLKAWDAAHPKVLARIDVDRSSTLVFSPDNKYLTSAGRVWEIATGAEVAHVAEIRESTFSPDGNYLITTGIGFPSESFKIQGARVQDKSLHFWLWQPEHLRVEVCRRLYENLKEDEWRRYMGSEKQCKTCSAQWNGGNCSP